MTNDRLKAIKKLIGCNCEWESFCVVGELMEVLNNEQNRAEQAEAQAAAMRLQFEKYVRENCKLIRHSVADGLDKPDDVDGKCGGYCQNFDEPHQICQECIAAYDPEAEYNDEVADAGTAILAENKRMREALERIAKYELKTFTMPGVLWLSIRDIAKAALEEKHAAKD